MKDITKIATPALLAFQQTIETASMQLSDFFSKAQEEQKKGTVSLSYLTRLEAGLGEKIKANNSINEAIDNELHKRLVNCFGRTVTTTKYTNVLIDEFTKEEENHKKVLENRRVAAEGIAKKHTEKVVKLDTTVSSEKKH